MALGTEWFVKRILKVKWTHYLLQLRLVHGSLHREVDKGNSQINYNALIFCCLCQIDNTLHGNVNKANSL